GCAARQGELSRRQTVSPDDGLRSHLVAVLEGGAVMRVLPHHHHAVNECWLSEKDRFSYLGLNGDDRLGAPMVKRNGEWHEVDWPTALDVVVRGLKDVVAKHGASALGTLESPHATLEELALAARLPRAL